MLTTTKRHSPRRCFSAFIILVFKSFFSSSIFSTARVLPLFSTELTAWPSSATTHELTDLLESLHREGTTLVVITHNPVVAARAQRKIAIRDGELTEHPPEGDTRAFPDP